MLKHKNFLVLFLVFVIAACSSNPKQEEAPVVEDIDVGVEPEFDEGIDASSSGLNEDGAIILDPLDDPASELFVRTVYFDYDSAQLREDSLETVRHHGRYLNGNPDRLIRLEGHADERGTREYNLALGESRAKTVRDILLLEGAQEEQIELVSFGEERPAVAGVDDSALQLNRRVEIVY